MDTVDAPARGCLVHGVLGPALFLGAGLTSYFGIGGGTAVATGMIAPDWFLVVALATYTLWGVGLLVSASSYLALTRPECPGGRASAAPPPAERRTQAA
ncbi:hypothetical protein ABTX15_15820 [Micromonospora sp. NPDC094482]|uniref:hypothetical protein n=1 Tax=unclassified Micromonospora TaxID=2617518 RepID=UPI0033208407